MNLLAVDVGGNKGGVLGMRHDLGFDAGVLCHGRDLPLRHRRLRAEEIGGVEEVVITVNMAIMMMMIPCAAVEGGGVG